MNFDVLAKQLEMFNDVNFNKDYQDLCNRLEEFIENYKLQGLRAINSEEGLEVSLAFDEIGKESL